MVCSPLVCSKGMGWKGLKGFRAVPVALRPSVCPTRSPSPPTHLLELISFMFFSVSSLATPHKSLSKSGVVWP